MNLEDSRSSPPEQGFSLIELLAVVGIIAVMAAVAIPAISTYVRNYRINGAEREVTSEITSARTRGVQRNTQAGVSFVVMDGNSYRYVVEDAPVVYGPLHDLPSGVVFDVPAANVTSFRFGRLGGWCDPSLGVAPCVNPLVPACQAEDGSRCNDVNPGTTYIASSASGSTVGLLEMNTGLRKTIRVDAGGRVHSVPQ